MSAKKEVKKETRGRKKIPAGMFTRINSRISVDHAKYIKLHKKGKTEGEFLRSMLDYYIAHHQ